MLTFWQCMFVLSMLWEYLSSGICIHWGMCAHAHVCVCVYVCVCVCVRARARVCVCVFQRLSYVQVFVSNQLHCMLKSGSAPLGVKFVWVAS